jgi:hypothetical protein
VRICGGSCEAAKPLELLVDPDQSAAARPTVGKPGESYQIGFVDVTDTPYPEITAASQRMAEVKYLLAERESVDLMQLLQETWGAVPAGPLGGGGR